MLSAKRFVGFFIVSALIYTVLMLAWPVVAHAYAGAFRFATQLAFAHDIGSGSVRILPRHAAAGGDPKLDTQLDLINLKSQRVAHHPISSRYLGYVPTVMFLALVLATPIPFARRRIALLWGLLLVHLFIALRLGLLLLSDFTNIQEITTLSLGSFGNAVLSFLAELISISLIGCYFGPILIWIIVTLRKGDWELLAGTRTHRA